MLSTVSKGKSTAPLPVITQLQAIYQRDAAANCVALVWPEALPEQQVIADIDNTQTRIIYCHSELAMREALVDFSEASERLVLLSKFDEIHLAKDVLARLWKNEPQRISPWKTLQQLIRVREIDPRLPKKNGRWMAEALLSRFDRYRQSISFGQVLDQDNAWRALALGYLDYDEATLDLQSLFSWSLDKEAAHLIEQLPIEVKDNLGDWLSRGLPNSNVLIKALLLNGQGDDLLSIGLACSVMYYPSIETLNRVDTAQLYSSRGVFKERFLAGENIEQRLLQQFGDEAVKAALQLLQLRGYPAINNVLAKAEQILASLDLMPAVELSTLLPGSLQRRLTHYAEALKDALKGAELAQAESALEQVKQHVFIGLDAQRESLDRAEMAMRLMRWLKQTTTRATTTSGASQTITDYIQQGGFADWARSVVWSGDVHEALNQVYQQLTEQVSAHQEQQNKNFSQHLAGVARGDALGEGVIPVEQALVQLVVPIAEQSPVLLLVLDGMSEAVYRELSEDLTRHHWLELKESGKAAEQCLLAALPSVTQVSRCSLLSGCLAEGGAKDEKKAFSAHAQLKKIASTKFPPTVFHKQDLQQLGSGALNSDVRAKLAGTEYKILAAVINAIDDQLGSSSQVSVAWSLDKVTLLRQVLEAAREAGRVVIITSDHGHVLDHDSFYHAPSSDNGERYQLSANTLSEYETAVSGARVVTANHSVVLPWAERLRYTKSKNRGYHGGGSLQELVIPLGVFVSARDVDVLAGWEEVPRSLPSWWYAQTVVAETASAYITGAETDTSPARKGKKAKKAEAAAEVMDDMFAVPASDKSINPTRPATATATNSQLEPWVDALFISPVFLQIKTRAGRTMVKDEQLRSLIELLSQHQGQVMEATMLRYLGLPKIRLRGFLAGAKKLLNVDGYPILSVERDTQTIKLNIADLKNQFEL